MVASVERVPYPPEPRCPGLAVLVIALTMLAVPGVGRRGWREW